MNILMIVDKKGSAIWRLAKGIQKNLPHFQIDVADVHPKRPDDEQIDFFYRKAKEADILDFEYWKTYTMLRENYPELMNKKKFLAHYNPYNLFEEEWDLPVTTCNKDMNSRLKSIYVPLSIDTDLFQYKRDITNNKTIQMVSGRIESKKGVLPVAEACKALGYKLLLIGSISNREYFNKIMATGVVEYRENVSDSDLVASYHESVVHVCNSIDNYESGTMPIIEAMLCGTPVLTRNVGHVPDLDNSKNMVIRDGEPEDINDLKKQLKDLVEDEKKRFDLRENAWNTAKTKGDVRRALKYEDMYWQMYSDKPLVSVIIPTFNRKEMLVDVISSVITQNYPAVEIVICDDGSNDGTKEMITAMQGKYPIKYVNTQTPDEYNLAYARNLGVIEASGKYVMFLDDRYKLDQDCVSKMVEQCFPGRWVYGNKHNNKETFVENFSMMERAEFIKAGMFNQSCKLYGFQSQELRERFRNQGFKLNFIESAKCEILCGTKNRFKKKNEILKAKDILFKLGLGGR